MFEYIDFPPVPEDLKRLILEKSETHSSKTINGFNKFYVNERIETAVNQEYPLENLGLGLSLHEAEKVPDLCEMTMFQLDELTDWVKDNVSGEFNAVHIQSFDNGKTLFPHVDLIRIKALNYILLTGGDAETVFYAPKKEFSHLIPLPNTYIPFDRIQRINSVVLEQERWHQLDVTKIHTVENLKSKRLSITVSFV
jgi:hypothetical protein